MVLENDLRVFESIRDKVPAGVDFGQAAIGALYEHAAGRGHPDASAG